MQVYVPKFQFTVTSQSALLYKFHPDRALPTLRLVVKGIVYELVSRLPGK
jgi:hypothetical protein